MSMTIGELIKNLRLCKPEANVYFDFCRCVPTTVESWRGRYAQPALGWAPSGYSAHDSPKLTTVAELIAELERAIDGRYFTGWKGGDYQYTGDDELEVDNPGDCTWTSITRVEDVEYMVVLHTENTDR